MDMLALRAETKVELTPSIHKELEPTAVDHAPPNGEGTMKAMAGRAVGLGETRCLPERKRTVRSRLECIV